MKRCAYCSTENRDEAIFCRHCKRPLQTAGASKGIPLPLLLLVIVLIGLGFWLFSSRSFTAPAAAPTQTLPSNEMQTDGAVPTRTYAPEALSACVRDITKIRRGPGTGYETTGGLLTGTCLMILGRNEEADWVYMVSDEDQTGWVTVSALDRIGDLSRVSVRDDGWMANPARPTLTSAEIAHGAQAYLTKVAATSIPQAPFTQYVAPCFETAERLGDHISCRVERAHCDYLSGVEGKPTFCSDRPYPDQTFALVVPGKDWSEYDGQCIIVSGFLKIDRGMLQIEALDRSQVEPCT